MNLFLQSKIADFYRMDDCGHTPYVQDPNVTFSSIVLELPPKCPLDSFK